jgi:multidrug efflux pump
VTLYLQPVQDLTIDAQGGPTQYRFALEGADPDQITQWTERVVQRLQRAPELRNVVSDTLNQSLAVLVDIDRDTAGRLAITAATVDEALYSAFGQRIISTIFTDTNEYRVILEEKPGVVSDPRDLDLVNVSTGSGTPTPLTTIAAIKVQNAPLQISRAGQFPAANIGFDTAPGVSLGRAVDVIRAAEADIDVPPSITTTFLGATSAYQASLSNELWLILAAIICVYIVLGVLYESFIHPLTILSTLPSAGVGALLALLFTGSDLDVIGIIGIVLLIGIVKKNAIMMIDFAIEAEREAGKSPREAIHEAALLRFRPILMTTMAALFAAVPLMLGTGVGHELRSPLGISIFGGLIVSQLLTLFTTPVIYLTFDRLTKPWRNEVIPPAGDLVT